MTPMTSEPALTAPVVTWRAATLADVGALTALINAGRLADGIPDETSSAEEVAHELEDPGIHLERDSRVGLDADGRIVAWGAVWCRVGAVRQGRSILFGEVHPDVRRRGVGRAVVAWQLERARERLASELDAGLPRRIELYALGGDAARAALAQAIGMAPVRWFSKMVRTSSEPVTPVEVPAGLELVTWSDAWSDSARDAFNDGWRDHWSYEPMPPEMWRHRIHDDPAFLRPASRLAIADDRVVGIVLCSEQATDSDDGRTAWLDLIAVRRAWRRRGVASAMIASSLVALADEGFRTFALNVDADSPTGALDLYRRCGFQVRRTETVYAIEGPVGA